MSGIRRARGPHQPGPRSPHQNTPLASTTRSPDQPRGDHPDGSIFSFVPHVRSGRHSGAAPRRRTDRHPRYLGGFGVAGRRPVTGPPRGSGASAPHRRPGWWAARSPTGSASARGPTGTCASRHGGPAARCSTPSGRRFSNKRATSRRRTGRPTPALEVPPRPAPHDEGDPVRLAEPHDHRERTGPLVRPGRPRDAAPTTHDGGGRKGGPRPGRHRSVVRRRIHRHG